MCADKHMHSFKVSEKRMEEGQALVRASDQPIYARVAYLPHNGTLMTLEYTTESEAPVTGSGMH